MIRISIAQGSLEGSLVEGRLGGVVGLVTPEAASSYMSGAGLEA